MFLEKDDQRVPVNSYPYRFPLSSHVPLKRKIEMSFLERMKNEIRLGAIRLSFENWPRGNITTSAPHRPRAKACKPVNFLLVKKGYYTTPTELNTFNDFPSNALCIPS